MSTYCISDIHGHFDNLNRFIETINDNDIVYVLGDVVDKGPKSIEILQLIMEDNRFKMLLGNHEYMMYQVLTTSKWSINYNTYYYNWVRYNSGLDTLDAYNRLPRYKRIRVLDFIKNLPLNYPNINVNNKTYYLVHSCPHLDIKIKMEDINFDDEKICSYVWDRVNVGEDLDIDNQIVIAGHTPVQFYLGTKAEIIKPVYDSDNINEAHYIDIDGGLATNLENSKLIVLCLDDLSYKLY